MVVKLPLVTVNLNVKRQLMQLQEKETVGLDELKEGRESGNVAMKTTWVCSQDM